MLGSRPLSLDDNEGGRDLGIPSGVFGIEGSGVVSRERWAWAIPRHLASAVDLSTLVGM